MEACGAAVHASHALQDRHACLKPPMRLAAFLVKVADYGYTGHTNNQMHRHAGPGKRAWQHSLEGGLIQAQLARQCAPPADNGGSKIFSVPYTTGLFRSCTTKCSHGGTEWCVPHRSAVDGAPRQHGGAVAASCHRGHLSQMRRLRNTGIHLWLERAAHVLGDHIHRVSALVDHPAAPGRVGGVQLSSS